MRLLIQNLSFLRVNPDSQLSCDGQLKNELTDSEVNCEVFFLNK